MLLSQIAVVVAAAVLAVPSVAAAQGSGDVDHCTGEVRILWNGLAFDPTAVDSDGSDWFVRSLETVSAGSGCAGLAQTLVLLDDAGEVLHRDSVVLDGRGNGHYSGVDARVEDVTEVQVLLGRQPPTDGPDVGADRGAGSEPQGGLPRTGADLAMLALLGAVLVAAGFALRGRIDRA